MPLSLQLRSFIEGELKKHEGRTDHMYLDSVGRVTIGVGHLIADRDAVASLTMYKAKSTSTVASLKEKQDEYDTIAKQSQGYKASWYKKHCTLIMKDADINAQRDKHVDSFYKELTGLYKTSNGYATDFDKMPLEVQKALFDMVFNLGLTTLKNTFVKFNNAVKKEEWDVAAKQSNRPQVNLDRNEYVRKLFMAAHKKSQAKANP